MMDKIWRLLVAIFILCAVIALLVFANLFGSSALAVMSVYAALILLPIGIAKGAFAIIDYHRECKNEEENE